VFIQSASAPQVIITDMGGVGWGGGESQFFPLVLFPSDVYIISSGCPSQRDVRIKIADQRSPIKSYLDPTILNKPDPEPHLRPAVTERLDLKTTGAPIMRKFELLV
jgi:hypothetical protein